MAIAGQDPPPDADQAASRSNVPAWPVIDKPSRGFRTPIAVTCGLAVVAVVFASTLIRAGGTGPDGSAFPSPTATSSRSQQQASGAAPSATTGGPSTGGQARTIDLTRPPDGPVAGDFFRDDGFLVSADPGAAASSGCENARSAAVITAGNQRFMTSGLPDDPTKCNNVPLLIDFLSGAPASTAQVIPLKPDTVTMDIAYEDLTRTEATNLTVSADQARARGGVNFLLVRPARAGETVAITELRFAPLS